MIDVATLVAEISPDFSQVSKYADEWNVPIGLTPDDLRPIDHVATVGCPLLLLQGSEDRSPRLSAPNVSRAFGHVGQPARQEEARQAAAGLSQVEMEQELRQASQHETGELRDLRVVGRQETTIKGEKVVLTISQGSNSQDQPYRMLSGIFQGKGGPTLLWIGGPVSSWDQAELDAFIASIR